MVFRLFWTLTRKTCIFTGKFLAGLSKLLFTCPVKHLRSNISERKSWKLGDFWMIFEVSGTMAENVFQVWQNSNRCPAGTVYWKTVSKEKNSIVFRFRATFYFERKKSARFAEPAIYVSVEAFGDFFLKFHKSFTLLWNFFQKPISWEIIFRVVTTAMRVYRGIFWGKKRYLKQSYFCSSVLKFEQFFCLLTKKSGCQRNSLLLQKKNGGKRLYKNCFLFKSNSDFE